MEDMDSKKGSEILLELANAGKEIPLELAVELQLASERAIEELVKLLCKYDAENGRLRVENAHLHEVIESLVSVGF